MFDQQNFPILIFNYFIFIIISKTSLFEPKNRIPSSRWRNLPPKKNKLDTKFVLMFIICLYQYRKQACKKSRICIYIYPPLPARPGKQKKRFGMRRTLTQMIHSWFNWSTKGTFTDNTYHRMARNGFALLIGLLLST